MGLLFSAYAEVFLGRKVTVHGIRSFSLPTQRCFGIFFSNFITAGLFSAYAEVFLYSSVSGRRVEAFLCLRRGVSKAELLASVGMDFSLPTQRCFSTGVISAFGESLFSAYAEVFLSAQGRDSSLRAFLCLRRGVS